MKVHHTTHLELQVTAAPQHQPLPRQHLQLHNSFGFSSFCMLQQGLLHLICPKENAQGSTLLTLIPREKAWSLKTMGMGVHLQGSHGDSWLQSSQDKPVSLCTGES